MDIKDFKDLKKVIQLCRSQGVDIMKVDNVEFHLGKLPVKTVVTKPALFVAPEENIKVPSFNGLQAPEPKDDIETDGLTEEQLLNWSVQTEAN